MNLYKYYYKDYFLCEEQCKLPESKPKNNERNNQQTYIYKKIKPDFSFLWKEEKEEIERIDKQNEVRIKEANRKILNVPFTKPSESVDWVNSKLCYKVLYPGLVTGIGIEHEANIKGEFKLGIHLDYLTGMPIIYGSTVKGILRTAFEDSQYIHALLKKHNIRELDREAMLRDIFDGEELQNINEPMKNESYKSKPIYQRDIFFDAVITQADSKGCVLYADSITPHKNPLRDPNPIPFIKIAPGCILEFRFHLVNSKLLTACEKSQLFKDILCDWGIGAKRNVGYGNLVFKEKKIICEKADDTQTAE